MYLGRSILDIKEGKVCTGDREKLLGKDPKVENRIMSQGRAGVWCGVPGPVARTLGPGCRWQEMGPELHASRWAGQYLWLGLHIH